MSNSKLAVWHFRATNNKNPRNHKIDKITIHHQAGNGTFAGCAAAVESRGGSCNYIIQSDGKIGVMVDEKYRSWCSSSPSNDHRAVTIEVANAPGAGAPDWHVSDKALKACIELCVDICKRNGIAKLNYTGNTNGNLTMHRWFAATGCPGPYLGGKFPYIAAEVNARLIPDTVKMKTRYNRTRNAVRIFWDKVGGADGYRVYRYSPHSKKWVRLATVGKSATNYRDAGLVAGTEYKYKVKAFRRVGGVTVWGNACGTFKAKTK